ncbi:hypothetical protein QYM36_018204 [Artemia franciscana]|uniref:Uncharacterized protein n=1 Tax=Artemia franciscana TaxID=6661 RepID=A0AA88KU73_ARTSF|nr:hypothetical protein QYM36_018204 [Artemia franciscana]
MDVQTALRLPKSGGGLEAVNAVDSTNYRSRGNFNRRGNFWHRYEALQLPKSGAGNSFKGQNSGNSSNATTHVFVAAETDVFCKNIVESVVECDVSLSIRVDSDLSVIKSDSSPYVEIDAVRHSKLSEIDDQLVEIDESGFFNLILVNNADIPVKKLILRYLYATSENELISDPAGVINHVISVLGKGPQKQAHRLPEDMSETEFAELFDVSHVKD